MNQFQFSELVLFFSGPAIKEVEYVYRRPESIFRMGVRLVLHLTGSQKEKLVGILLSILASLLFSAAENFMSESEEDDE